MKKIALIGFLSFFSVFSSDYICWEDFEAVSKKDLQGFLANKIYRLIRKNSAAVLKDLGTPVEISFPSNPNEPIFFGVKITTKDGHETVKVIDILPNTFLKYGKNIDDALNEIYANRDKHGYTYAQQKLVLSDTLLARLMHKHIDQKLEPTTTTTKLIDTGAAVTKVQILPGVHLGKGIFQPDENAQKDTPAIDKKITDKPEFSATGAIKPVARRFNVNASVFTPSGQ